MQYHLGQKVPFPKELGDVKGLGHIDKAIVIDQSPIGRTPRSNPATYTGAFDAIREVFTKTIEAKARGYKAGRFSFNVELLVGTYTLTVWDHDVKVALSKTDEVVKDIPDVVIPEAVTTGQFLIELNATIVSLLPPEEGQQYQVELTTLQSGQALADPSKLEGDLPAAKEVVTLMVIMTPKTATA